MPSDSRVRWPRFPSRRDVYRVMCYGDSLTDGPPRGGWPSWLHRLLAGAGPCRGPPIRGLERGRGRVFIAPGRAAIPAGSRPLSTRPRPGLVRLERRGRGHRPARQDVQDSALADGRVPAGAGAVSCLSRAHVLHAKVASRAAGGFAGAGFTASERRGLPGQHGPIPNRGRPQGDRDRVLDPAAQASAGRAEQELNVAGIGAQIQRGVTRPGAARTTCPCSTPSTTSSSFRPNSSATSAISRRRAMSGWPDWCVTKLVAEKPRQDSTGPDRQRAAGERRDIRER